MSNDVEIVVSAEDRTERVFAAVLARARLLRAELRNTLTKAGKESGAALGDGIITESYTRLRATRAKLVEAVVDTSAAERQGRTIGSRLGIGIRDGMSGSFKKSSFGGLRGGLVSALKGALATPVLGPVIVGALAAAASVGATSIASIIAGGIISGLGAGLVGIGAMALLHVEKIDDEWSAAEQKRAAAFNKSAEKLRVGWRDLNRDIISGIRRAAQPLLPVLDTVQSTLRRVGREFEPVLGQAFKIAKSPLKRFIKDLGDAFLELKPAIGPIMTSFGELLDQVGPMLPGAFQTISDSIIDLAGVVSENRDLISALFVGLIYTVPVVIGLVSSLTGAFRGTLVVVSHVLETILGMAAGVIEALALIPGAYQAPLQAAAASIRTLQGQLANTRVEIENFPKKVKLEGDIRDLEAKIAAAKVRLRDPKLTRPERAHIRAEISDLQRKVAAAKASLASLKGRTIVTNLITKYTTIGHGTVLAPGRAHGGIIGGLGGLKRFAQGGVAGSGSSLALVGEQGPELVRLPVGSGVTGAGQTRALMGGGGGAGGGGFGSISMAFRPGGQATGGGLGGGLGDSLREVISFREALEKLTSSIFGQERALSGYEAAWDAAGKSLKENGRHLSLTTEKGRENRSALLNLAEAAQEVVIAMQEQGRATSTITAKMKEQRSEFISIARRMGLSKSSATDLANRYGLTTSAVSKALSGKASGGPAGGVTLVGERGPELVRLPFGSAVTPAGQTAAALAGGGGGGGTLTVVLETRGGDSEFDRFMAAWIRQFVHVKGGNVQGAFGRR